MKFALRSLGGIALYVAAANLLRAPRAALTTAIAMSIGAVVAACLMWAELHLPGAAAALAPFHVQSFDVFDLPRASGPFQYPNIAAMYLEAALPVVLAAGAAFDARRARGFRIGTLVAVLGGVAIVQALSLTASRAAMLTALVVVAAVGLDAFWRKTPRAGRRRPSSRSSRLLAVTNTALGSLVGLRMKFWNDDVWYRSTIAPVAAVPGDAGAGRPHRPSTSTCATRGVRPWPATGREARRAQLSLVRRRDGGPAGLRRCSHRCCPHDVAPGATRPVARDGHARRRGRGAYAFTSRWSTRIRPGSANRATRASTPPSSSVMQAAAERDAPVVAITAPPPMQAPLERAPRPMLWRAALMAWREHPLLGPRPGQLPPRLQPLPRAVPSRRAPAREQPLLRDAGQPRACRHRRAGAARRRLRGRGARRHPPARRRVGRGPDRRRAPRPASPRTWCTASSTTSWSSRRHTRLFWLLAGVVTRPSAARDTARASE